MDEADKANAGVNRDFLKTDETLYGYRLVAGAPVSASVFRGIDIDDAPASRESSKAGHQYQDRVNTKTASQLEQGALHEMQLGVGGS